MTTLHWSLIIFLSLSQILGGGEGGLKSCIKLFYNMLINMENNLHKWILACFDKLSLQY
jgi:hypothetical protein